MHFENMVLPVDEYNKNALHYGCLSKFQNCYKLMRSFLLF